jgi:hypothetical protein
MIIATNIRHAESLGFQLILDENLMVIGVNLLCNNKILIKKRFNIALTIKSKVAENELVNRVITEYLTK